MPKKLTLNEKRSLVSSLWANGIHNVNKLHEITHIPKSTLYTYVPKLKKSGTIKLKSRLGRPKLLSPKKRIHLGKLASTRKCATSKEIAFTLNQTYPNLNIASRTVRENLFKLGYRVCVPTSIPMLTGVAKERRVEWAKSHLNENWKKVIFSDETTFQLFRNTTLVRYKIGEEKPRRAVVKHPLKVHAWGAFCANGLVGFHCFTENMNGELYRDILTKNLFTSATRILGRRWTFQQDNDPKHRAKLTTILLQEKCPRVLDWPSYSPDLNPIENLWAIMKKKVEKRVNQRIVQKKSVGLDDFLSIIRSEWENLSLDLLSNLCAGMKKRLEDVIEKEGQIIKH